MTSNESTATQETTISENRGGHQSTAATLRYLALGDSIARGFRLTRVRPQPEPDGAVRLAGVPLWWFDAPETAYPSQLGGLLAAQDQQVEITDLARSGAASGDVWRCGSPFPPLARISEARFDFATLTLGANDLLGLEWMLYAPAANALRGLDRFVPGSLFRPLAAIGLPGPPSDLMIAALYLNLDLLLDWLDERVDGVVAVTNYYNSDGTPGVQKNFTDPINDVIRAVCEQHPRAHLVDLESAFRGHSAREPVHKRWISPFDGVHPNAVGQQRIADQIFEIIRSRLGKYPTAAPGFDHASHREHPRT